MWSLLLVGLRKTWPYFLGAALILGLAWWAHHRIYESGYAASEAKWQPRFAQAERELKAANEKARRQEEDSRALSDRIEEQHAKTVASLTSRAADAERRYASILRQHSAGSRGDAVPQDGGAAGDADAARALDLRNERAAKDFGRLARGCEADAAALTDLQQWVRGQLALQRR